MHKLFTALIAGVATAIATYRRGKRQLEAERQRYLEYTHTIVDGIRSELSLEERIPFARLASSLNGVGNHEDNQGFIPFHGFDITVHLAGTAFYRASALGFGESYEQKALDIAQQEKMFGALAYDHAFLFCIAEYDEELLAYLVEYHSRKPEDQPIPVELMPTVEAATQIVSICHFWEFF